MAKKEKKNAWLKAVREAMHDATIREAKARYGSRRPAFNYRWEHVKAVAAVAERLAEQTGADRDIVLAAAWLHDICKDAGARHPHEGADFARVFLKTTTFPPAKIERVAQAIADHMGLWRETPLEVLESQVLWDADKLTKIGVSALVHWTGDRLSRRSLTTTNYIVENGDPDWAKKSMRSMHTQPARDAAKARIKAKRKFLAQLKAELRGDDLFVEGERSAQAINEPTTDEPADD